MRTELIARLSRQVCAHPAGHTVRVAVDGPDAAGKTTLADDLAEAVRASGRPALRVGAVLVVDGVFLQSAELAGCWEMSVYLDVRPEETLRRALVRDVEVFGSADMVRERYQRRYLPDVVLGYDDPAAPVVLRWPRRA
jgi:uridine kinase